MPYCQVFNFCMVPIMWWWKLLGYYFSSPRSFSLSSLVEDQASLYWIGKGLHSQLNLHLRCQCGSFRGLIYSRTQVSFFANLTVFDIWCLFSKITCETWTLCWDTCWQLRCDIHRDPWPPVDCLTQLLGEDPPLLEHLSSLHILSSLPFSRLWAQGLSQLFHPSLLSRLWDKVGLLCTRKEHLNLKL